MTARTPQGVGAAVSFSVDAFPQASPLQRPLATGASGQSADSAAKHGTLRFFEPPQLRKEKPEDEGPSDIFEDWIEFVGDLILVACLFKCGDVIKYCGINYIYRACLMVFMVWRGLWNLTSYVNYVKAHDILRVLILAALLMGTFLMVLYISDSGESTEPEDCNLQFIYVQGFCFGYVLSRAALLVLYSLVITFNPSTRGFVYPSLLCWCVSIVIVVLVTYELDLEERANTPSRGDYRFYSDPDLLLAGYTLATLVEVAPKLYRVVSISCCTDYVNRWFLVHISHYTARLGTVVMVCLGEAILALLATSTERSAYRYTWIFQLLSFFIILGLAFLHFNSSPHEIEHSVLRTSRHWAARQELMYWSVNISLFLVGVGLKLELYVLSAGYGPSGRRLAAGETSWTQNGELNVVGFTGISLTISQLLLLGIEVAQRRETMWDTRTARIKLGIAIVLALGHSGWFVVNWAIDRQTNLIIADCVIHNLMIVPAVLIDLRVQGVVGGGSHATLGSHCALEESPGAPLHSHVPGRSSWPTLASGLEMPEHAASEETAKKLPRRSDD